MIFGPFGGILWLLGIVCAILVIVDVFTKQKKMSVEKKVLWTVFAVLFSIITAIVYYFVVKKK